MAQPVWPMGQADGPIQVLMHGDGAALERAAPAHRFDLQVEVLKADRVIAIHRTLELQGEDQIQIAAATRHKRTARLRWRHLKTTIKLGPVALPQKSIGRIQRLDPGQSQLLRQPALPGAEVALASSPRLLVLRFPILVPGRRHCRA